MLRYPILLRLPSLARHLAVLSAVCLIGAAVDTTAARAQFVLESPEVEEGSLEFESNSAVLWGYEDEEDDDDDDDDGDEEAGDDGDDEEEEDEGQQRQGHEFSIGYGVTDFWMPTVGFELSQDVGESLEVTSIAFENTFQILSSEDAPVGLGFFAAYEGPIAEDSAHEVAFGPLVQIPIGPVVTTINPLFERQFGEDREEGFGFNYGWQTLVEVTDGVGVGFEAFGEIEDFAGDRPDLNEQEHRIGPMISIEHELGDIAELAVDTGFLFGLTDETSDYAFKINFEVEIEF